MYETIESPRPYPATLSPGARKSPICEALLDAMAIANRLASDLRSLEKRLSPVLGPPQPAAREESDKQPAVDSPSVAEQIREIAALTKRNVEYLEYVVSRLEV